MELLPRVSDTLTSHDILEIQVWDHTRFKGGMLALSSLSFLQLAAQAYLFVLEAHFDH